MERDIAMYGNGNLAPNEEHGLRQVLGAIGRRKWIILATFIGTAAALGAVIALRVSYTAVCHIAVKKPLSVLETAMQSSAAVPILDGRTYKEMVGSLAFATQVASSLTRDGLPLSPGEVRGFLQAEFRDPDLLRLTASTQGPSMAVRIANAGCQALVNLNQKDLRAEWEAQVASITQLLGEAGKEVEGARAALTAYMQQHGLLNVDFNSASSELSWGLQILAEQEMVRAKEEAALQAAEERLGELKIQRGAPATMLAFPVEDPAITTLRLQLEAVRTKLWDARKQFTENHPAVKELRTLLGELQREMDGHVRQMRVRQEFRPTAEHELAIHQKILETNQEIIARKAQIAALTRLIQEERRALGAVPSQRAEVEQLKLSLAFAEARYRTLSGRLDETRISLEAVKGTLSIVQPAVGPEPPGTRRKMMVAALLLLALPLGVGLLVDYMDDTIRSPVAFGRKAGLLCLGTVPKARQLRSSRVLLNGSSVDHLKAFHILRSGLRFASGGFPPRKIAIIGTKRREGRSTLVLHLARALAEEQKRVVIVDADLRSSSLAHMLGINSRGGLVEVLTGECSLDAVLHQVMHMNTVLIPAMAAGRTLPPNTELLFRSPQFQRMVDELCLRDDVLLFDTPPILEFADALELLPHMDGVILVAEAGNITSEDVQRALELVRSSGTRGLGVVLNKVRNGGRQ